MDCMKKVEGKIAIFYFNPRTDERGDKNVGRRRQKAAVRDKRSTSPHYLWILYLCKFAYLPKFICNLKINTYGVFSALVDKCPIPGIFNAVIFVFLSFLWLILLFKHCAVCSPQNVKKLAERALVHSELHLAASYSTAPCKIRLDKWNLYIK